MTAQRVSWLAMRGDLPVTLSGTVLPSRLRKWVRVQVDSGPVVDVLRSNLISPCVLTDRANHSADVVEIWHGAETPAIACGFHAAYFRGDVFAAHRAHEIGASDV